MFNITVLGCNGPFPAGGGACSSYLVETDNSKVLFDAGSGSMSNLMKLIEPDELDCIILSHLHWDHMTDIPVMYYNLLIKSKNDKLKSKIDIYLPGSPAEMVSIIKGFEYFNVHIINEDTQFKVNGCTFSFKRMTHPVECYAVKAEYMDKTFVYTGDTTFNEKLPEFAQGCNLLLADAAFLEVQLKNNSPHMSAAQCALVADEAGVLKLILTHHSPYVSNVQYENEAKKIFAESHAAKLMEKLEV